MTRDERLISRVAKVARIQPPPPRQVTLSGARLTWVEPQDTRYVTHYNVYVGSEAGNPRHRVPVGQDGVTLAGGDESFWVSAYNDQSGIESTKVYQAGKAKDEVQIAYAVDTDYLGSLPRSLNEKLGEHPSALDFGADATGAVDASVAIQTGIDACAARGVALFVPRGTYKLSGSLAVDVAKTQIISDGAVFDIDGAGSFDTFGTNPLPHVVRLYSSGQYSTAPNRRDNNRAALENIRIVGGSLGSPVALNALLINGTTLVDQGAVANFAVRHCSIDSFDEPVRFGDNSWRVLFDGCEIRNGIIKTPTSAANFAENMMFRSCLLADELTVDLNVGLWMFHGTSIDNATVEANGDVHAVFSQCHFENPANASSGYRYVDITSTAALVILRDCDILLNDPSGSGGTTWNKAFFTVPDASVEGLHLRDCQWFFHNWFHPETDDVARLAVSGSGRVTVQGFHEFGGSFPFAIARGANIVSNGGFESGLQSWHVDATGTPTADAAVYKLGAASLKCVTTSGQYTHLTQIFGVEAQKRLLVSLFLKADFSSGAGRAAFRFNFYDADGLNLSDIGYVEVTATQDWTAMSTAATVPIGARYGEILLYSDSSSGTVTAYFDDVVVNLA